MSEESQKELQCKFQLSEIKKRIEDDYKTNFFDVQIHCRDVILPAHRYVLSSSSDVLAKQLASGVNKLGKSTIRRPRPFRLIRFCFLLDWTWFEHETCIALLRWIYTNEFVIDGPTGAATASQWLDLLQASYNFQLISLFETCEQKLLLIANENTSQHDEAIQLLEKCSELRLNVPDISPEDFMVESDDEVNILTTISFQLFQLYSLEQIR